MATVPVTPDPRRYLLRLPRPLWIGVATAVLVVLAVALQLGPVYRQYVAIREIERIRGHVKTVPRGPQWLRERVGQERMKLFDEVTEVDLVGTQVTDAGLAYLKGLPHLQRLRLSNTDVSDAGLARLQGLAGLQELSLDDTQVTDHGLAHLEGLTSLRGLSLAGTQVTDAGLAHLQRLTGLKVLWLDDTQVTDHGLAHLKGLTSLQVLSVNFTLVTAAGLTHLQPRLTRDELKIVEALEKPTSLEFVDVPLENCIAFLQDCHKINIWLDRPVLNDEGVALDQPITLRLEGVSLRRVLMLLLEPMQLTYVVEDNVLNIIDSSNANNRLITHTYPVRDLYQGPFIAEDQPFEEKDAPRHPSSESHPGDLRTLIAKTIDPESWDEKLGLGSMTYVEESGSLVIRQTPSAHDQIRQLLLNLGEAKRVRGFPGR